MKKLILSGDAKNRGHAHGEGMREHIQAALAFYLPFFQQIPAQRLQQHVGGMIQKTRKFRPQYIDEMDAIAEAANVDAFLIYCINSRSELISSPLECSSIAFPEQGLLGQNWDWSESLEGHLLLATIQLENGLEILTLTEPGMLAKIGLNSAGLGICLNILPANELLTGLPVHILLRALLESESIEDAVRLVQKQGDGKTSHITLSDADLAIGIELSPARPYMRQYEYGAYWHTNHYLEPGQALESTYRECSEARFARLTQLFEHETHFDIETMKAALNDKSGDLPINRPYTENELMGSTGTLATLIMDLNEKQLLIREGHDPILEFESIHLQDH